MSLLLMEKMRGRQVYKVRRVVNLEAPNGGRRRFWMRARMVMMRRERQSEKLKRVESSSITTFCVYNYLHSLMLVSTLNRAYAVNA